MFGFRKEKDPPLKPCCDVNIVSIFAANHQHAVKKAINGLDGEFSIVNSALVEDGTKLGSTGEQVVSIILEKEAGDDDSGTKTREKATGILKKYAKQFAGQELVDEKIYALDFSKRGSAPVTEEETGILDEAEVPDVHKQALYDFIESKGWGPREMRSDWPSIWNEIKNFIPPVPAGSRPLRFSPYGRAGEENTKKAIEEKWPEMFSSPKLGYYFVYDLQLGSGSAGENSKAGAGTIQKQSFSESFEKIVSAVFDGVKIRFTSLFGGGGDEITGKQIRKGLTELVFPKVDPSQLIRRFDKLMHDTFPSETPPSTRIYDQQTMIEKIRAAKLPLSPSQRRRILAADYSFAVKVESSNRARSRITPALIAKIMTKAIVGGYSRFRNAISASDVIVLTASKYHGAGKAQASLDIANRDNALAEAYSRSFQSDQLKIVPREVKSSEQIFDLLFERRSSVGKVSVRFMHPEEWFDPKGEKAVFKDGSGNKCELMIDIGDTLDPSKNPVAKRAYELAIKKFETAVFAGWDPDLSKPKVIDKNIDFVAKYKKKQKSSEQSDLENAGDNFDYYVIPMPGFKYPDEDDYQ